MLVNAYENVGNHLYRLNEALGADIDQEAPRAGDLAAPGAPVADPEGQVGAPSPGAADGADLSRKRER